MKYENAKDILPEDLLKKLQEYASGKLLYVPSCDEKRSWGEASGYRDKLQKRNRMICNKYANGVTISELADEYFLSLDSIKKIIYSRKNDKNTTYSATLKSAVEHSCAGRSEEWIHTYLLFSCNETRLSEQLLEEDMIYLGVVKLPLRLVQTEGMLVSDYMKLLDTYGENVSDLPPLIIMYEHGKLQVTVQTELFLALKNRKVNAYPAFILIRGNDDYKRFMKLYGTPLLYVNKV